MAASGCGPLCASAARISFVLGPPWGIENRVLDRVLHRVMHENILEAASRMQHDRCAFKQERVAIALGHQRQATGMNGVQLGFVAKDFLRKKMPKE